jgi:hypothetical protein
VVVVVTQRAVIVIVTAGYVLKNGCYFEFDTIMVPKT